MIPMKEIGGEFWDIPVSEESKKWFPLHTKWYLSGRTALAAIVKDIMLKRWIKSAALPSYCCDSIIIPFVINNIQIKFYDITIDKDHDGVVQNYDSVTDCDVIVIMDFFGYIRTPGLKDFQGIIIRDLTHTIFCSRLQDADYYFGSLRKWAGFWTGGYAWKEDETSLLEGDIDDTGYSIIRKQAMEEKAEYMKKPCTTDFLNKFVDAETCLERLANSKLICADGRDIRMADHIDDIYIRDRRRENAGYLIDRLKEASGIHLIFNQVKKDDCPMFVPIFLDKKRGQELQQWLIKSKIYCPIHWPVSRYHNLTEKAKELYDHEISLVCDQRYLQEDMEFLADRVVYYLNAISQ